MYLGFRTANMGALCHQRFYLSLSPYNSSSFLYGNFWQKGVKRTNILSGFNVHSFKCPIVAFHHLLQLGHPRATHSATLQKLHNYHHPKQHLQLLKYPHLQRWSTITLPAHILVNTHLCHLLIYHRITSVDSTTLVTEAQVPAQISKLHHDPLYWKALLHTTLNAVTAPLL